MTTRPAAKEAEQTGGNAAALALPVKIGLTNVVAWMPVVVLSGALRGYDVSGDLSNGEVVRALWMFAVSPAVSAVCVVWSAMARSRRPHSVPAGMVLPLGLPLPGIILPIIAALG